MALCSFFGPISLEVSRDQEVAKLTLFAVKGATLQVRIEFHFLKTPRSPEALLVPGGNVDGRTLAFFFRFRAFKDDDFSWHVKLQFVS